MMGRQMKLLDELRTYQPADAAEARHCARVVDLLTAIDAPFSRVSFRPGHITASCFIVDKDERLLLHHHRRLRRWLQMGGHVEEEESPRDAALREGSEESGLRDLELIGGIFDIDVHAIPAGRGEPDHDHFDVRYLARTRHSHAIAIDRAESDELAWVTLADARGLMRSPESWRVIRKIETSCRS
jgi:8-oxo-dGTP pyrophosphatase MutT (NUDIX family)